MTNNLTKKRVLMISRVAIALAELGDDAAIDKLVEELEDRVDKLRAQCWPYNERGAGGAPRHAGGKAGANA